jgi:hypothetical protein
LQLCEHAERSNSAVASEHPRMIIKPIPNQEMNTAVTRVVVNGARAGNRSMSTTTAKVWVNKDTKVVCQGLTGGCLIDEFVNTAYTSHVLFVRCCLQSCVLHSFTMVLDLFYAQEKPQLFTPNKPLNMEPKWSAV